MGTVRFVLRTDKIDSDGKAPIELIYQLRGKRKYHRTREKLLAENWNSEAQEALYLDKRKAKQLLPLVPYDLLPSSREVEAINRRLAGLKQQISETEILFELSNRPYDTQMVISSLKDSIQDLAIKEAPTNILFEFIDQYLLDNKFTREPGSLSVYRALKKHLHDFQKATKRKVTFEDIDYAFFQEFQNYLIDVKQLNNTTVAKQLSTVKTFLVYARKRGITITDRYKDFKIKRETLEVIALTNDEFLTLFNLNLSTNKRLEQVRDVFCFACATGLRYSDLAQLRREHIKSDEIRLVTKKTKEPLSVPLNPYSEAILKKYKGREKPLPVISNQKMNEYLKGNKAKKQIGLCELAGITEAIEIVRFRGAKREAIIYPKYELIGVHTGRKTFATLSLEKGMSAEETMAITGHKDYKSFKRYVKVTEQRKKLAMQKAWS